MIHVHELDGCAPLPLAHYLKALGILRLVAEQADPQARGWWEGERFRLATTLDRTELLTFFLERYEPTPVFNPWGARSGYYGDPSEAKARKALQTIEKSSLPRLENWRNTISLIRRIIAETCNNKKPGDKDRLVKNRLVLALRRSARGKSTLWLETVCALTGIGNDSVIEQPALLGTGGNEGSGSYTSAHMQAIASCLVQRCRDQALDPALFAKEPTPDYQTSLSMGQFIPGGIASEWDFLLVIEGACIIRSAVSSRSSAAGTKWMSSPFFIAPTSSGYASEARFDELFLKNGKPLPGRGEQWFPLWNQPARLAEIERIFVDGRANTRRGRATDGWSMARAVTSRGVQLGISEFVRYGYQQRNNLASHYAVPLGRFPVPVCPSVRLACLDDLDAWLPRLRREARQKTAPARLAQAERNLVDALFAVAQHPDETYRWQAVLMALAAVESIQVTGSGFAAHPVPHLRPEWARVADDGSAEFRLALSLALQGGGRQRADQGILDPVRRHWLPLDEKRPGRYAVTGSGAQARLTTGADVVMRGRSGIADAIALVERRLIEAAQRGARHLPLLAASRTAAHPADLAAWLAGALDAERTLTLARVLMALDGDAWAKRPLPPAVPHARERPDDAWLSVRLALLPWPLPDGRCIGTDPAILRRLASGDATSAVELARRRLRAAGIGSTVRVAATSAETARLWAAALAFPITPTTAARFARRLDPDMESRS